MLYRLLSIVLGAIVAWQLTGRLALGLGYALAGPAFAAVLLLAALLAERFAPRPAPAGPRSASLAVRKIRHYLPRRPAWVAGAGTVVLLALLGGTTIAGGPDSQGRPGRALNRADGSVTGPWPGSYYSIPILIATALCLALTIISLQALTRRPRLSADDTARRRAAGAIVSAYGIAVLTPLAGCAFITVNGVFLTFRIAFAIMLVIVVFWSYLASVLLFGGQVPS